MKPSHLNSLWKDALICKGPYYLPSEAQIPRLTFNILCSVCQPVRSPFALPKSPVWTALLSSSCSIHHSSERVDLVGLGTWLCHLPTWLWGGQPSVTPQFSCLLNTDSSWAWKISSSNTECSLYFLVSVRNSKMAIFVPNSHPVSQALSIPVLREVHHMLLGLWTLKQRWTPLSPVL